MLRLLVTIVNLITRVWLKEDKLNEEPVVSILIPARNEEKNIGLLIESILKQDYQNFELIVYNDESTDKTESILEDYTKQDQRIRLIGGCLLDGWLGKNNACHRLAQAANGEYLLFLDADVIIENGLIKNSLSYIKKYNLKLFSIFPKQDMCHTGEKIVVPLMHIILVSLLPLILIRKSNWSSFSAANGQFMLFDAQTYKENRFHEKVKNDKVEDISILRYMKQKGYRVSTLLSNGQIRCRMYDHYHDAMNGFSKNVLAFFGGSVLAILVYLLSTTLGIFIIFWALHLTAVCVYVICSLLLSCMISILSGQSVLENILYLIPRQVSFLFLVFKSLKIKFNGNYFWKGRLVKS